ncbi:hypothetical protein AMTR_s00032p00224550 [Amborella trichopoda]|uniref:Uncharacterized protein n=1 Tax=Amborella trichopoda TaxID=13333 RepID=U5CYE7_AMBTC|nr:hypothetical protein AMTR_s00032p00224550 [Amborella trichopoda]
MELRIFKQGEQYINRSKVLKQQLKALLAERINEPVALLELIDSIQRLGVVYHFEEEIQVALDNMYTSGNIQQSWSDDLYTVSLAFRLLRQHGYHMSSDVFGAFKDEKGSFKVSLVGDVKGMLSLYEASHLCLLGEHILDAAWAFNSKRLNITWESMSKRITRSPFCLNLLQWTSTQWWADLRFATDLPFVRDRLVETLWWTIGLIFEPEFSMTRLALAKISCLIASIDDVYDIYGSEDELELFTMAVQRWDLKAMKSLPDYMKICYLALYNPIVCYLALYNTIDKRTYNIMKEKGWDIKYYLKKMVLYPPLELCNAFLVEAKWFKMGYTLTLDEYLSNGWISVSGPLILVDAYFLVAQNITEEAINCTRNDPNLIRWPSLIFRLCNDLATSTDEIQRGDAPTSIQCYMHETGASEELARSDMKELIRNCWKKLKGECLTPSLFPKPYTNIAVNLARMAYCMYHNGDGYGNPDLQTTERIKELLIQPM